MKNGWPRDVYEQNVLWLGMHRRGRFLARVIHALNPGYFKPEKEVVGKLADAIGLMDFREVLKEYKEDGARRGIMRRWFKTRLSGARLLKLGTQFYS